MRHHISQHEDNSTTTYDGERSSAVSNSQSDRFSPDLHLLEARTLPSALTNLDSLLTVANEIAREGLARIAMQIDLTCFGALLPLGFASRGFPVVECVHKTITIESGLWSSA